MGAFALGIALAFFSHTSISASAAESSRLAFNIPSMPLVQALHEFSAKTGVPVNYAQYNFRAAGVDRPGANLDGKSQPVIGEFTPSEALAQMLKDTGYHFDLESDETYSVLSDPWAGGGSADDERLARFGDGTNSADSNQEVIVTGSLIRSGLDEVTAPLVILTAKEKKKTAYGTVQDVLTALTQNFGGGANEDFFTNQNYGRGVGLNLRGLGIGTTLLLVNGRRQPASGMRGDFSDVSSIPLSAVDHFEILTDGSSAIYGSDAIGGVVNVVMRQDLRGSAETQVRFGSTSGGAMERLLAQSFGNHWDGGKWLFTYQYLERSSLAAGERDYSADADKRALGGSDWRSFSSNPGNILDPFTQRPAFAIPDGQDGTSLSESALLPGVTNLHNQMSDVDLLPNKDSHSAYLSASQKIGERFELFGTGLYNLRHVTMTNRPYNRVLPVPSSNPFFVNPFGGPFVLVSYNFLNEFGYGYESSETTTYTSTLGLRADITPKWQATLTATYGKETLNWHENNLVDPFAILDKLANPDPAVAFNPFGSGSNTSAATLDAIRYTQLERAASDIKTLSIVADGPILELPAGPIKLGVGVDQRRESLFREESQTRNSVVSAQYARDISSGFAEVSVPITSKLSLSAAGRYEAYNDFGHTFNPKFGLRWKPSDSLLFRSSWGTSFRAPTLVDLYDKALDGAVLFPVADPHSPSGFSLVLGQQGSNPTLHEEKAKTWTAGVDFAPDSVPGFSASMTYYAIQYGDRIFRVGPPVTLAELLSEDRWSPLVSRNPSRSEIDNICRSSVFIGSVADCLASSPAAILDVRIRNLSSTNMQGLDAEIKQTVPTAFGKVGVRLRSSYVLGFDERITRSAPDADLVGTVLNPPKLRVRGTADWYQHGEDRVGWGASVAADYFSGFRDPSNSVAPRVAASATFDAQLSYRTLESNDWIGGIEVTLNAVNVFNKNPPFFDREQGYDPANARPYGRVVSIALSKIW